MCVRDVVKFMIVLIMSFGIGVKNEKRGGKGS